MKIKMLALAAFLFVVLGAPVFSYAETATTTTVSSQIQTLMDQIKNLQTQIANLKTAQEQVVTAQTSVNQTLALIRNLKQGISGDDVKALQAVLAADPTIYPEGLISGYYGKLTAEAVKKFQKKHGIETVGFVGPKTLKKLNEEIGKLSLVEEDDDDDSDNDGDKKDKKFCVPPGHLIAPGWLKKNGNQKPTVEECKNLPKGISKKLGDDNWNNSTTTNNYIVPMINTIVSTNTGTTTASLLWTTNKNTTSSLWYGTTTPLNTATSTRVDNNVFKMNHSYNFSGLTASTTYYYIIKVSDTLNNSATSTERSFNTLSN